MAENDVFWVFGYGSLIWKPTFPFVKKLNGFIKGYSRRFYQGSTDHRGVPGNPGRVVTLVTLEELKLMKSNQKWRTVLPENLPQEHSFLGNINNVDSSFNAGTTEVEFAATPSEILSVEDDEDLNLSDNEEFTTWGVAYCVLESKREEVISYLDYREKGGYTQHLVDVYSNDDAAVSQPVVRNSLIYLGTLSNPNFLGIAPLAAIASQIVVSKGPSGANLEYLLNLADALRAMNADDKHVFKLEKIVRHLIKE